MTIFPIYENALELRNVKENTFPFYIGLHTIDSYPVHHHELAEMGLVLKGNLTTHINGVKYAFHPGTLFVILPHQIHDFTKETDSSLELVCCMFDIGILSDGLLESELSALLLRIGDDIQPYVHLEQEAFATIQEVFLNIQREFSGREIGRNSYMRAKLVEAVMTFVRSNPGMRQQEAPRIAEKRKDTWKLIQYVNTHYMQEEVTLELLSSMFKVSVPYISRTFKEFVGQSFLSYLHSLRIRRASSLLASTEMSISDIAAEVGFESFRTFSRVFKELKGVTPSDYRQSVLSRD